jgi:hypothetical protein
LLQMDNYVKENKNRYLLSFFIIVDCKGGVWKH